jgi:hypothetical protein
MVPWLEAPKGRDSIAQGIALGIELMDFFFALKGRHQRVQRVVPPLQGLDFPVNVPQGVAP